jgi:drug/metabolite transporter (DMT)-like permease
VTTGLALLASLLWGTSDFLGGTASRRLAATMVVLVSQGAAFVGLVVVVVAVRPDFRPADYVGWGVAAAVVGIVALTSFYVALAEGTMGVVAPIAALGVAVPVMAGVVSGDRPSAWQGVGLVVAIVGVVLASGPELRGGATSAGRRPLLLAGVAAVGFGAVVICVAHGARSSSLLTLLVMRTVSVVVLLPPGLAGRLGVAPRRGDLPLLVAVGAGDIGANAALAVASTRGLLSVVAVLSSLYPAITVLLARAVHDERLRRVQSVGVVAALGGVVLIASGG